MRPPRCDALQMLVIEIARPPNDFRQMAREIDRMLASAAADLHHIAEFTGEKTLYPPWDRRVITGVRGRVETAVGLPRSAALAECHKIFSHLNPAASELAIDQGLSG